MRAADPDYLAAKARKAEQKRLKREEEDFERRSKLTALSGEDTDTAIFLAIYSGKNYRMSSEKWTARLSVVSDLFVRKPDFKGFVKIDGHTFPVLGFLGTLNGELVSLDLFSLKKNNLGNLTQVARGQMTGNNDTVRFHVTQGNKFVTCELQVDKQRQHDSYMFVVGRELHSRMFNASAASTEDSNHEIEDDDVAAEMTESPSA